MRLSLFLARVVPIVIVMIAVYAMPSAAVAHPGHESSVTADASQAGTETEVSLAGASDEEQVLKEPGERASARSADKLPCNGGCCSGGSSCCAPAVENPTAYLTNSDRRTSIVRAPTSVFSGVDPNLFRRPPKFFL
jgi:hypothetical protein